MGKIKKTILRKQDRPAPEQKPPSMRRYKRMNHEGVENSRAGRNSRLTPSRPVNLRSLRRSGTKAEDRQDQFAQVMPRVAVFTFKKKHRPVKTLVHEHYSQGKDRVTSEKTTHFSCKADDSATVRRMELMAKQGLGKISYQKSRTIWHKVEKQDMNFKR